MIINSSTELMKNQKNAVVMAPDKQFEVLQTQEGNALFFSIGTDNVFYLTREIPADTHGWSRIDLSSALSALNNNATVTAKLFDVAQDIDPTVATTDLALIITVNGVDLLYVSTGNANTNDDWSNVATNGLTWTAIGFDGSNDNAATLNVADINFCQSGQVEFLQADIIQNGSNSGNYINRYFIDYNGTQSSTYWNPIDLPYTISAGDIHNEVGYLYVAGAPGTYTLSGLKTLNSTEMQLMFWPFWNPFGNTDPMHINFQLPPNTTAMAPSQAIGSGDNEASDDTSLFVAAGSSLYFVPNTKETLGDVASGFIYTHPNLSGVRSLHVNNTASKTVVWGLNENEDVFYMSCAAGSEATAAAWSVPAIIVSGIDEVVSFINGQQNNNVIFAQTSGNSGELVQLTQDPATAQWAQRNIHLPTTDPMDTVYMYTFTTHIQLTDSNNVPLQNQAITITPSAACSVYINNSYYALFANTPVSVTCDAAGIINIMQSVDTLGGVCFYFEDGTYVNPMTNVVKTLSDQSGSNGPSLDTNVQDENGNSTPLVSSTTVSEADKQSIALFIANFIKIQNSLPENGGQQPDNSEVTHNLQATPSNVFGILHKNGRIIHYSSIEEAQKLGLVLHNNKVRMPKAIWVGDDDGIEVLAGDGWRWLKNKLEEVEHYYTQLIGSLTHFFFEIAGQLYHFAIRCIHDIASGIHFLLNKIAVAFEDMIKWLGTILAWKDMLRTHDVFRSLFLNYISYSISQIGTLKGDLDNLFQTVESQLNQWAGLPEDSYSSQQANNSQGSGQSKPSAHWANHHAQNSSGNAKFTADADEPGSIMDDLINTVNNEYEIVTNAVSTLNGVLNNAQNMPVSEVVKQVVAVIADTVLESVQNIFDSTLDIAENLTSDIADQLTATIQIPVLSSLYKMFTGKDLSLLDLTCLLIAVPTTIIYKLDNGNVAPFPSDDDAANAIINASSLEAIADICFPPQQNAKAGLQYSPNDLKGNIFDKINFFCNLAACFGGISIAVVGTAKVIATQKNWSATASSRLSKIYIACYLPYIAPDIGGVIQNIKSFKKGWYDDLSAGLGILGFVKTVIDYKWSTPAQQSNPVPPPNPSANGFSLPFGKDPVTGESKDFGWYEISPLIETGINLVWEVPAVFSYLNSDKKTNDIISLTANTCFNAGGVLTPFVSWTTGTPQLVFAGICAVLNVGYGALSAFWALDNYSDS